MGFRFFRRIKVLPGLTINLTKRGISASLGVRGAKITTGTSGTRATVGVPGTGLFYTKKLKHWSDPPIGEPDSPGSSRPPTPPTAADAGQASPSTGSEWVPAEPQDTSGFTDENRTVNPDEPEGRRAVGLSPHSKGILDGIAKDLVSLESALGDPTFTAPRLGGSSGEIIYEMKLNLLLVGLSVLYADGVLTDDEALIVNDMSDILANKFHLPIESNRLIEIEYSTVAITGLRDLWISLYEKNSNTVFNSTIPYLLLAFDKYDAAKSTSLGLVVRLMYFRFANAIAKCDGEVTAEEKKVLSAFDRLLFAGRVFGEILPPSPSTPLRGARDGTASQPRTLAEIMTDLNALVGLQQVKEDVLDLVNFMEVQKLRLGRGLHTQPISRHLVFLGNPGTGKTTVARLLAEVYRAMGVVRKGHLVEVDRSGLVAGYLGQTALKVSEVVEQALGGLLFIDEAYSLAPDSSQDLYGEEAVATLVKAMEDHRDDLVVVVAGYTDKMNAFVQSNPGLESRFTKYLNFADYSPEQLVEIFKIFCSGAEYRLSGDVPEVLLSLFAALYESRDESFGNARLARNGFEKTIENQATRIVAEKNMTDELLRTIVVADLPTSEDLGPGPVALDIRP